VNKRFIVKRGSRVRLEIPAGESADTAAPDERKRGLIASDEDPAKYVFRDSDTVQVFDLGTRFTADGVNEYVEQPGYVARVEQPTPVFHGAVEADLAALDSLLLGKLLGTLAPDDFDPLGSSPLFGGEGRAPNVLPLNHLSDLPSVVYDLQGLTLRTATGEASSVADEGHWKWRGRNLDPARWAESNTEIKIAPAAGAFARKGARREYVRVSADDYRYWSFDTGDPDWKVTDAPDFSAPVVPLAAGFPLKVYAVPRLWSAYEVEAGAGIVGPSELLAVASVVIEETGIHSAIRFPAVPGPFGDLLEERSHLSSLLNTRRRLTYFWPGQGLTEEVTYLPRLALDREALQSEAIAFGEAHYAGAWAGVPTDGQPLSTQPLPQKPGHLSALIVIKKQVFYVWRAG
jgi:hypothetical protein